MTTLPKSVYDFWYDLRQYLHHSWLTEGDNKLVEQDMLVSAMQWNQLYRTLCFQHQLCESPPQEIYGLPAYWLRCLPKFIKRPQLAAKLAGASLTLCAHNSQGTTVKDEADDNLSPKQQQAAFRRGQCLMLQRRFPSLSETAKTTVGLWLLYQSLDPMSPELWRRIRLAYDRSLIISAEKLDITFSESPANRRTLTRLWRMVGDELC